MTDSTPTLTRPKTKSLRTLIGELADAVEMHFIDCPDLGRERDEVVAMTAMLRKLSRSRLAFDGTRDLFAIKMQTGELTDKMRHHAEMCS